jgi:hypothetical protein
VTEKIQKVPFGLNELLRIQQSGTAPDQFADTFIGTVDSIDFFGATNLTGQVTFVAGKGVRGDRLDLVVPGGELWRVFVMVVSFDTFSLVGATVRASATITPIGAPTGGQPTGVSVGTVGMDYAAGTPIVNIADVIEAAFVLPVPQVLMPGSTLSSILRQSSAAGTFNMNLRVLYQRLAY